MSKSENGASGSGGEEGGGGLAGAAGAASSEAAASASSASGGPSSPNARLPSRRKKLVFFVDDGEGEGEDAAFGVGVLVGVVGAFGVGDALGLAALLLLAFFFFVFFLSSLVAGSSSSSRAGGMPDGQFGSYPQVTSRTIFCNRNLFHAPRKK